MIAKGVTVDQVKQLVSNRSIHKWKGNVIFNRAPENYGRSVRFTLRCDSSRGPGHRRGFQGQRMVAACFHAYTDMIKQIVKAGGQIKATGFEDGGTWITSDNFSTAYSVAASRNIGSIVEPLYYAEACDCQ